MARRISMFVVAALMLASFIAPGRAQAPEGIKSISVHGGHFIDDAGRQVVMRGICAGGRSKLPPFYPFDPKPDFDTALANYADKIKAYGFNVVRLLIIFEAAEPTRGQYDEAYLKIYDKMVKAFADRGIWVVVDSHQDIFSRRFGGDGFPDWAIDEQYRNLPPQREIQTWGSRYFTKPVASSFDKLWLNKDGLQDSYTAFFKMLAARYRNEPAVIGFEPINEPMPGLQGIMNYSGWIEKLFALYENVGNAVHAVDKRYLIFIDIASAENTGVWDTERRKPRIENLVFTPHYYDPGTFGKSIGKGGDRWFMRHALGKDLKQARNWNVPMFVSEYGISPLFPTAPLYIDKLYSVFDELQLSGTIWEASISGTIWNKEDTSVFNPDGSIRERSLALDRPYPRAIAGIIELFSYDSASGSFKMIWKENPDIRASNVVYIPKRIYGNSPKIELKPTGDYTWDIDTGKLVIAPLGGNVLRKVTVSK